MTKKLFYLSLCLSHSIYSAFVSINTITTPSGKQIFLYGEDHENSELEARQQISQILEMLKDADDQKIESEIYIEQGPLPLYKWGGLHCQILSYLLRQAQKLNLEHIKLFNCEIRNIENAAHDIFNRSEATLQFYKQATTHYINYALTHYKCLFHTLTFHEIFKDFEEQCARARSYIDFWPELNIKKQFSESLADAYSSYEIFKQSTAHLDHSKPLVEYALNYKQTLNTRELEIISDNMLYAFCHFIDIHLLHQILLTEYTKPEIKRIAVFAGGGHTDRLSSIFYRMGYKTRHYFTGDTLGGNPFYCESPDSEQEPTISGHPPCVLDCCNIGAAIEEYFWPEKDRRKIILSNAAFRFLLGEEPSIHWLRKLFSLKNDY